METLVENVDLENVATPIKPLLKAFAASPYLIAPERKAELEEFVIANKLRIRLDATTDYFEIYVHEDLQRINFPLRALERLWAYAYCHTFLFKRYQSETPLSASDLTDNPEVAEVLALLTWLQEAESSGSYPPWPDNTPRPDNVDIADKVQPVNQVFFVMTGFILLHEVGHLFLKHAAQGRVSDEVSIRHEFEADSWAADWVLSRCEVAKTDDEEFAWRTYGIAHALATMSAIEVHFDEGVSRTHPNSAARLLAFLDHWVPARNSPTLLPREAAWKLGPCVIHAHLLKSGKALGTGKTYPTYRSYLEEAQTFL